jgi:polyhydroxyalkanoate synthesis regulator phasin
MADDDLQPLIDRIAATTPLGAEEARRVVQDVIAYLSEAPEAYVRRRHQELKHAAALRNDAIFDRLAEELSRRVFAAPRLSARQIRRMIYG